MSYLLLGVLALGCVWPALAELDAVKAEKNLQKRAKLAMENADAALDKARAAYMSGEMEAQAAGLTEVEESVALAYQSLKETGKNPRKASRHYKRAEIGSRKLLRRLDTFRNEMSYLDRDPIDKVIQSVTKVHDDLLKDVMGGAQ
jgi:hypothetical protein